MGDWYLKDSCITSRTPPLFAQTERMGHRPSYAALQHHGIVIPPVAKPWATLDSVDIERVKMDQPTMVFDLQLCKRDTLS